jgi:hypothetical protein
MKTKAELEDYLKKLWGVNTMKRANTSGGLIGFKPNSIKNPQPWNWYVWSIKIGGYLLFGVTDKLPKDAELLWD